MSYMQHILEICRTEALARSFVWWPRFDSDLEQKVKNCIVCHTHRKTPPQVPLYPWKWSNWRWTGIHVDYAGLLREGMSLIVIDSYCKWMEVFAMNNSTSCAMNEKFWKVFTTHGLPERLVSDNESCFTSEKFERFFSTNGIIHVKTALYHLASNVLAERPVKTFKEWMEMLTEGSIERNVSRFLFQYGITSQSSTSITPAE